MAARTIRWLFIGGGMLCALLLLGAPACLAQDPTDGEAATAAPTPVAFARPQFLVWMESHGTSNGPMTDNAYWLYTSAPDENGHLAVPDGDGGVFHYTAQLVSGPYADDSALCPAMLSRGIATLSAWPPGAYAPIVDCARFRPAGGAALTGPGGAGTAPAGGGPFSGLGGLAWALGLAGALAAAIGGLTIVATRMAPAGAVRAGTAGAAATTEPVAVGPQAQPDQSPDHDPNEQPDPCASQELVLGRALDATWSVQRTLEMERATVAELEMQIARIANVSVPAGVLMDLDSVLMTMWGARAGAVAANFTGSRLLKAGIEGTIKAVLKSMARSSLELWADGDFARLAELANRGEQGALRGELKELIVRALMNQQLGAGTTLRPPMASSVAAAGPAYDRAWMSLAEAQAAAKPIADALTSVFSVANATAGTLDQMGALDTLRGARDRLLDQVADQEMRLESRLEDAQFARERLNHCREINAPGRRP